jgi:transposase, IS30 family
MGERYSHLTLDERCRLGGLLEMGVGVAEIARRLDRHRATIHREIKRNSWRVSGYRPVSAARMAWARKLRGSRVARSTRLRAHVEDRLAMGWSPEQIVGRMELEGSEHRISVESIYRHIYSPEGRRDGLPRWLAQRKRRRGRRRRNGKKISIPNRVPIQARPEKANLRSELGHWEGDVMHFRGRQALLTLEERSTRLTRVRRLHSMEAASTAQAIVEALAPLPPPARRSITHDNGCEFAAHGQVTEEIGLPAYFCDPHSPWQRGSIENTNGLLRRPLPRGTNLATIPDAEIDRRVDNLNATPRKCLGWRTPLEVFNAQLGVALET